MTITLTWWVVPIIIVVGGFLYMLYVFANADGYFGGIVGELIFFTCVVAAVFLIIGHFL